MSSLRSGDVLNRCSHNVLDLLLKAAHLNTELYVKQMSSASPSRTVLFLLAQSLQFVNVGLIDFINIILVHLTGVLLFAGTVQQLSEEFKLPTLIVE